MANIEFKIAFGRLVRLYREKSGLQQLDVARLVYRDEERTSSVSDVERGRNNPQANTVANYREALQIPTAEIDKLRDTNHEQIDVESERFISHLELIYTEQLSKHVIWLHIFRWDHDLHYLNGENCIGIKKIEQGITSSSHYTRFEFDRIEERIAELTAFRSNLQNLLSISPRQSVEFVKISIRDT